MAFKSKITPNIGLVGQQSTVTATVAASTTNTVIGLQLSNTLATYITVSVKLNKNGGTSAFLIKDAVVMPGGTLVVVGGDQKLVLEEADTLTAYASAQSACDVIISYLV